VPNIRLFDYLNYLSMRGVFIAVTSCEEHIF
jgi:hypothetical protein